MATVTAQALIAAGLRRAKVVDSPTGFIAHPSTGGGEAFDLMNDAISELWDILYEADSEDFASNTAAWSTVANQASYALATIVGNANYYRLKGIDFQTGSGWKDLDRINRSDKNRYPVNGRPLGYRIEGDNIIIHPTPDGIYSMQVNTIPLPQIVANDADTVDLKGPWREFVQKHFAKAVLDKKERDTSALERELYGDDPKQRNGGLAQRVRAGAKKRDSAHPTAPVDVQQDDFLSPYIGPYGLFP